MIKKSDLQSQKEQDTWTEELIAAGRVHLTLSETFGVYTEYGKDFVRFQKSGKLWELSIKEVKPRKTKKK